MWDRLVSLASRLYDVVMRRRVDDEARRELDTHLDLLTERYVRLGMSPVEARRAAGRQFGNALLVREEIYESHRLRWVDDLGHDLRYTLRMLHRSRSFAAVSILTLALGVGVTTTMFSVGYGVLIRPLPYPESDQLVRVWESHRGAVAPSRDPWLSNLTYDAWNDTRRTIGRIAAFGAVDVTLDGDPPVRVSGARVSPWIFDVLRISPLIGRFFHEDEAADGANTVVVLSDGLWRERFGGDPGVIGRTIAIDQRPYTIVGIAPPGFAFPYPATRMWMPFAVPQSALPNGEPRIAGTQAIARLVDGMTAAQATLEGTAIARRQPRPPGARFLWGEGGPVDVHARTMVDDMTAGVRPVVLLFLAGVGCLLLIACANVTNLLLLRGVSRGREFTVRAAIGASRGRMVRQLLTESLVTASLGAALGIALAWFGIRVVQLLAPANFPRLNTVRLDLPVVVFACALSLVAGTFAGLPPAIRAARRDLVSRLRDGVAATGPRTARLRSVLVAAESAVAVVLVVAAVLLGRSLFQLLSVDVGYDSGNVLVAEIHLPDGPGIDPLTLQARSTAFLSELLNRLRALPGVAAAGAGNMAPFGPITVARPLTVSIPGRAAVTARSLSYVVTPGYAEALRLRLRAGRLLNSADVTSRTQSIVVNEAFVRTFLDSVEPVGFAVEGLLARGVRAEVVGVLANVRKDGLDDAPEPEVYLVPAYPLRHDPSRALAHEMDRGINLVVRTDDDPAALAPTLRAIVRELRRDAVVDYTTTLNARTTESVRTERFAVVMLTGFSALALLLAAIGLYTVLSYSVSTRQREIGVRTALGANQGTVAWLVVREGMRVTLAGLLVGIVGALFAARFMRVMLFGIEPYDPLSLAVAPLVLAAVALMATVLPARRAMRTDPLIALRSE